MEQLEEDIGDSVRPKNKFESQGESIQDSCKTSNDVRSNKLLIVTAFTVLFIYGMLYAQLYFF